MDWRRFITWSHHLVLPCIVSSCFISVKILESSINIIQHQLSINYPSTICHQRRGSSSALAKASGVGAWKGSMVRFHLPAVVWITFSPSRSRRATDPRARTQGRAKLRKVHEFTATWKQIDPEHISDFSKLKNSANTCKHVQLQFYVAFYSIL